MGCRKEIRDRTGLWTNWEKFYVSLFLCYSGLFCVRSTFRFVLVFSWFFLFFFVLRVYNTVGNFVATNDKTRVMLMATGVKRDTLPGGHVERGAAMGSRACALRSPAARETRSAEWREFLKLATQGRIKVIGSQRRHWEKSIILGECVRNDAGKKKFVQSRRAVKLGRKNFSFLELSGTFSIFFRRHFFYKCSWLLKNFNKNS